ncbi:phage major capsid protein [Clostridium botulinum]|uniref:Phage major capsid protein n=1 Tax=Clostridium botulinum TaxID=1491 RepID=A0A6B4JLG8_CLOBO|nr:phage major capsid protein [Clostridium botulinum]EES50012.1 phage major capsid protein, HK97 family [Clostridium botulinum E1 str. 'BoNT E Beluga']MBY6760796.1 phage major capsid protein [Clostridium botulinum]MBY6919912.1 phage major capsid protein [Clostridium botulinum]MCR1130583.1 phage major capsid protein [Clostridium botulinum]NFJ57485.1 phage major capsid protein [Clostridium botulinum]
MKIEELREQLETKKAEVRSLNESNKIDEAEKVLEEVRNLDKQIKIQEEIEESEMRDLQKQKMENRKGDVKMEKVNETRAFVKKVLGKDMTEEERATVKTTDNSAVLPPQYINKLVELKKGFGSLKYYCDIIPVTKNEGTMPIFDPEQNGKLKDIAEGDVIPDGKLVTTDMQFKCKKVGIKIPLSSEVIDDAEIDIENAVNSTFAESTTMTENYSILQAIDKSATVVDATDYTVLEDVMSKALPTVKAGLVTLTNVEGYALLKNMKDKQGRNLGLITVGADGREYFNGKEIVTFDSSLVTLTKDKKIVFYSLNMKEAVKFFDRTNGTTINRWNDYDNDIKKASILERLDIKAGITRSINKIEL